MAVACRLNGPFKMPKISSTELLTLPFRILPQVVARMGVPVVVVVSVGQYDFLTQKEHNDTGFARFLLSMPTESEDTDTNDGRHALKLSEVEL